MERAILKRFGKPGVPDHFIPRVELDRTGGPHLDGKFAAFGRVIKGMEVADAVNRAPAENEKPVSPVRIKHAGVAQCPK